MLTGKKGKGADEAPWMDRLVDVLLSLLASASGHLPSVPLRDAAEGLFRVFATHLTPTGEPPASSVVHLHRRLSSLSLHHHVN